MAKKNALQVKAQKPFAIGSRALKLEDFREIVIGGRPVTLAPQAVAKIEKAHAFLQKKVKSGETFYGINTGFGLLSNVRIPKADLEQLQYNLLRSHAVGTGEPISVVESRGMVLLRAVALAQGHSGVSLKLVELILELLNRRVTPVIPAQGSVGASGDLAPLSHLALVLIGEGEAWVGDSTKILDGDQALRSVKLKPITLGPKEGLALINGTQFMTSIGALNCLEAEHLADLADAAGALTLEALRGTDAAFSAEIHKIRPHPGQVLVAKRMREFLAPRGKRSEIALSHEGCGKVQDPYSLRCIPQVHGASRDSLAFVRSTLECEMNAVTDNPLLFPDTDKILSGGNFHGQGVAIAMDLLSIAVAELASISEQRLEKLVNPAISELPAFLVKEGGLHSGFMIVQVAAAAIVSENKTLAHPASVDSIPTSADKEDHVSMGAWAARKASQIVLNSTRVIAMEFLAAAQGLEFLRPLKTSARLELMHSEIRKISKPYDRDRSLHKDIERLVEKMRSRDLVPLVSI